MPKAVVDQVGCTGCGICEAVCPTKCITIHESDTGFNGVALVERELCNGCLFCAIDCPWDTISIMFSDGSLAEYRKRLEKARGYA